MVEHATAPPDARLRGRELGAWRGFLRAHAALAKELDAQLVAAHGLSLSSYEVLLVLEDAPEGRLRMSELADSVLLSRSGITRLVDRLAADGLLERVSCPTDRRGLNAALTAKGRERLREARSTHLAGVRSLYVSKFSDAELDLLCELWDRVLPGASS